MSTQIPSDMSALLLDLLMRRCQVRFSQSLGDIVTGAPGASTKCWVRLLGHGELTASEWCGSPEAALREAHDRATSLLGSGVGQ